MSNNDNNDKREAPSTPVLTETVVVPVKRIRVLVTDPVERRVEMVNGWFELPDATKRAMNDVRAASEAYARALHALFRAHAPHVDVGRSVAAIDSIQHTKNVACDAFILPHATKEVDAAAK